MQVVMEGPEAAKLLVSAVGVRLDGVGAGMSDAADEHCQISVHLGLSEQICNL